MASANITPMTTANSSQRLRMLMASGREYRRLFEIDLRSLAAFRIGVALLLLYDLTARARDLAAHYTDSGVLPRSAVIELRGRSYYLSLHMLDGSWPFQSLLFACAGLFAVMLLVGYRTRLATIASWVLLVSLQVRNPLLEQGGDVLLRCLLFWSMFLPLGACCSLDRIRQHVANRPGSVLCLAGIALLLQVCLMYWFAFLLKSDPVWGQDGTALYFALNIDAYTTWFGRGLLQHPELLRWLTYGSLYLEGFGPFLVFVPFVGPWGRLLAIALFALFHLGIALSMNVGYFPFVCWVAWLPFLPAAFWDFVRARFRRSAVHRDVRPTVSDEGPACKRDHEVPYMLAGPANLCRRFCTTRVGLGVFINLTAFAALYLVVAWNLGTVRHDFWKWLTPPGAHRVLQATRLHQNWGMFAPGPMRDDGWYVIPGTFQDDSMIDLFTGRAVTDEKPADIHSLYPTYRWRRYLVSLSHRRNSRALPYYAKYLVRDWNRRQPNDARNLVRVNICFWSERTMLHNPPQLRKLQLLVHVLVSDPG